MPTHQEVPCAVHPYAGLMHDPPNDDTILLPYVMDHPPRASLTLAYTWDLTGMSSARVGSLGPCSRLASYHWSPLSLIFIPQKK